MAKTGPEQKISQLIRKHARTRGRLDTWLIKPVDVPPGFPDLIGAFKGTPIAIEVKVPGEEPRPNQEAWLHRLRKSGYTVTVVHDYDEFIAWIETPGVIRQGVVWGK